MTRPGLPILGSIDIGAAGTSARNVMGMFFEAASTLVIQPIAVPPMPDSVKQ
jgi:hypothetical protein